MEPITVTRWRWLSHPVSPLDPIDCASMFKEGKLPCGFVLLLTDGERLQGPIKFPTQEEADGFLEDNDWITHYMPVPMP